MPLDAAAGTASRRTLAGTGSATSAAKSDHTHTVYDRDNGQAGILAPNGGHWVAQVAILTASRAYWMRFVPSRAMTITSISFVVGVQATADDAWRRGDLHRLGPGTLTRVVSKGATTGLLNTTGTKNVAITSTPLTAGTVYYAAFSVGTFGGTGAQLVLCNTCRHRLR